MAKTLRLDIVTPERVVYSSDGISMVIARAVDGETGILPGHAPLITALEIAPLRVKQDDTEMQISLGAGFMDVKDDTVTILVNVAELPGEIDVKRAEAAKSRAETRLQNRNQDVDFDRAEAALRRALVRLKVAGQAKVND
ncbi:ATP synthase F1 subunit epsilon [Anaerosporomusa subterranea]|uniref:ATP synthase epsilon chain n=1 Tax=Anaerosporomusa subterranea TaxID=1794912 RepID=A0A154BQP9_ANASB|nr:F0F1 ATP synthase subunit epsilon [Anaerosporomusa subterranea]KYZ76343.1 ATP synthase F1 subunit epsilon [Anaerosporomusa subterranea]